MAAETSKPAWLGGFRLVQGMRPEGFEPPTNGLEGRRSSTELRARLGQGSGVDYLLLAPKSAVTIVVGALP
jgi:hypothetical protein